ncbi:hypothetical protein CYMTET_32024 [Cymbomonas tetramitiformis]|uniref:Uncharacterized protein n=1 Tax=Cymbomonas tetramitiformis TaxID=36881 RepID=A0AAE0FFU1_9CHLO|nr:hypothetical protein CYMTET_32024 [Cymbomonas tetramitiformis]
MYLFHLTKRTRWYLGMFYLSSVCYQFFSFAFQELIPPGFHVPVNHIRQLGLPNSEILVTGFTKWNQGILALVLIFAMAVIWNIEKLSSELRASNIPVSSYGETRKTFAQGYDVDSVTQSLGRDIPKSRQITSGFFRPA